MRGERSHADTWTMPVTMGVLSLIGLAAALLFDGVGDAVSWLSLSIVVAVCLWGMFVAGRG